MRKTLKFLLASSTLLLLGSTAAAQGVRIGPQAVTAQGTIGTATNAVVLPAAPHVTICVHPANGVPCTNYAATFTDSTIATQCGQTTQIVLDGTTSCIANPDAQNNWGAWVKPGQYDVVISLPSGTNLGPYFVTASLPVNPNVQIVSTVPTGTAPFSIASTTVVPNLNAQLHGGLSAPASAIVGISDTQTLTNKTLTAPVISSIVNTGTLTLPTSTDTLVGRATTDTFTNKTLTSPTSTGTDSGAETLTNKILTRVQAGTTAPTCSVTGAGTGATCSLASSSNDNSGNMQINTGTAPGTSGTWTLTFSASWASAGFCSVSLGSGNTTLNARATAFNNSNGAAATQSGNWDNNGVAPTASQATAFLINYVCVGH